MASESTHIDKALAERMLRGDQRAFDEFFHTNFPRLYRFCLLRVGDEEDAIKEITQRTLCRAIDRLETYRGEASLFTWLCRLCRNEISDYLVRERRQASRTATLEELEVVSVLESLDAIQQTSPEDGYRRVQIARFVQAVMDHLPLRQSNVLEWKYVQGLSVDEIATRMDISAEAVGSLLARARRAFRDGFSSIVALDPEQVLGDPGG